MKKRAFQTRHVQLVRVDEISAKVLELGATIGHDISKAELVVCLRYGDGTFERPWKAHSTRDLGILVDLLKQLNQVRPVPIGLESTGTYGDALRQALTDAGLDVRRVSSTACATYAETFDGVPSQHDAKDAAIIAELVAFGKSRPWPWQVGSSQEQALECWVQWLTIQQETEQCWLGRVEAWLGRHWPELTGLMSLGTATLLRVLSEYGDPAALSRDAEAKRKLARWGGSFLVPEKIEAVLESARRTVGVRVTPAMAEQVQRFAREVQRCRTEEDRALKEMAQLAGDHAVIQALATVVGFATACIAWVTLGDVRDYSSGPAYRKAMGLNLKERSSGKHKGQLKITKRGSGLLRRWLYFAAMRTSRHVEVNPWYEAKKKKENGRAGKALVAIMRKLALAMYRVGAQGASYEARLLFPAEPLSKRHRKRVPELHA
jgi:transposase